MVLSKLLTNQTVKYEKSFHGNWEDAIKLAADPLVIDSTIDKKYVNSMIDNVKKEGPYINIGSEIALAHARPNNHVKKIGLSFLKTGNEINLIDKKHPIKLWFVLAAIDNTSHLDVIKELMNILMDSKKLDLLLNANSQTQLLNAFNEPNNASK
ncbi:PTS sugar transporter subunit IIA [Lactobacillus acetotolerans]|jgi:PTS system ascorbate-specific IIA component|uniref:Ascorbate-specific PTS system EIIA component n=1 Tax=Lactobacillus acetotolerans TaxID=1600 RepID=A0A5P5ZKM7_9LACO|nr:PTS sugar transporter subunit IIA [Lactobacillus acetotolerans]QFG51758.1 PTS sugar transporter subunit IIA [Lactobacillus acetotolerans]GGV15872.1 PTS mannitol transporter subunit IIA [Lactobacillus acetotolerans DSM 20749 = JCM 3825]